MNVVADTSWDCGVLLRRWRIWPQCVGPRGGGESWRHLEEVGGGGAGVQHESRRGHRSAPGLVFLPF